MIRKYTLLVCLICSLSIMSSCSSEKSENTTPEKRIEPQIVHQSDFKHGIDTNRVEATHINVYFPDKSEDNKDYLTKWSKTTVSNYGMYVIFFFSHQDSIPEIDIPTGINDPLYSSNCFAIFMPNETTFEDEFYYVDNMRRINP